MKRSKHEKPDSRNDTIRKWEVKCNDALAGKCIRYVWFYLNEEEQRELGCYRRHWSSSFDDGSAIYPSVDEEGNDARALFPTLVVLKSFQDYNSIHVENFNE